MFFGNAMPSASSLFSAYASMAGSMMLVRSMANDLIPQPVRSYIISNLRCIFKSRSQKLTLIIEESSGMTPNQVFEASMTYLSTKISSTTERLRVSMSPKEHNLTIRLDTGEEVIDYYDCVEMKWRFDRAEQSDKNKQNDEVESRFELSFDERYRDLVFGSYIPFILKTAKAAKELERVLKMYTLSSYGGFKWDSINFEHPATFDTLAMDPKLKLAVMDDLKVFVKRKDFYKRVGKAWKRGYLLYGPPGTGKSSLIAAMANYLKFNIYDLQLANVIRDTDLRKLLLSTSNRSILVIEDIDCNVDIPNRRQHVQPQKHSDVQVQLTLSGLLNFIDGLWSSCGDERIIIFTTNHKEKLDPALLRPGRMDMHIHMSYCTLDGFKHLANNYLGISGHHPLFEEIEGLLENAQVTPAQIAEELMRNENAESALEGFVNVLKRKRKKIEDDESEEIKDESEIENHVSMQQVQKKQKSENGLQFSP